MFTEVITERKQMDQMKSEFISTVNHELRTPLTSIQASLGLLKTVFAKKLDANGQKLLNLSYDNCERLAYLVNDILDMEKIMAGKMDFIKEKVTLSPLVKGIFDQNTGYAEKYNVSFGVRDKFKGIEVEVDTNRFNQALTNLISNAAKFSPYGGKVYISIEAYDSDHVKIFVKDSGPGIPKALREKIFERFSQADSSTTRAKGGTGLGLIISKNIIEAFGGNINFATVEGKGSTFYFILPICK